MGFSFADLLGSKPGFRSDFNRYSILQLSAYIWEIPPLRLQGKVAAVLQVDNDFYEKCNIIVDALVEHAFSNSLISFSIFLFFGFPYTPNKV